MMDPFHHESQSVWQRIDKPFSPPLAFDLTTDVCVIGAGISGLTTAYLLLKEGKNVIVIDRERLGMNQTGLTTAHLSNVLDDGFQHLRRLHGTKGLQLAVESHARAIDTIEKIAREEEIDCEFQRVDGYLFNSEKSPAVDLDEELKAAHESGLTEAKKFSDAPLDLFRTGPCLQFGNQAQFHPVKYLLGLSEAIQRRGGRIFSHTAAAEIKGGYPAQVTTAQGYQIHCDSIVIATNVPFNVRVALHTKMAAYRSYAIGVKIPRETLAPVLLWDTENPYHYVRVARSADSPDSVLIVGGEDHRVGHDAKPEERYFRLLDWVRNRLLIPEAQISYHWSGQIIEPMDGLAFIGRSPGESENVFLITGDSGHGLTHGTIGALVITDQVMGRENAWSTLYDPSRINWKGIDTFIKETVQSTSPYTDWITPGDVDSVERIEPGEGAVVRDGLKKMAVYRDHAGSLHSCSAVCPHLGGIVRWNSSEKTWDCPCHGSRFDKLGEVINGPAAHGLNEENEPFAEDNLPLSI